MNGFLDSLIARAQGTAQVAEPLISPYFAPSPWQIGDPTPAPVRDPEEEPPPREGPDAQQAAPAPSVRSVPLPREPVEPGGTQDGGETGAVPPGSPHPIDQEPDRSPPGSSFGAFERTGEIAERTVRSVANPTQRLRFVPSLVEPQGTDGPAAYAVASSPSEPDTSGYGDRQVEPYPTESPGLVSQEPGSAPLGRGDEPAIRVESSDHPAPVEPGTLYARAAREFEMDPSEGARRFPPSPPEPTVQVTIGRVEVKATTPPAPPQPVLSSRPKEPALSLDEYLKRRNEGRR